MDDFIDWENVPYEEPVQTNSTGVIFYDMKKLLGIEIIYDSFDDDILIHMNSVVGILEQLGAGPRPRRMLDTSTTWDEYGIEDPMLLGMIKTYMGMKIRSIFDPPTGAAAEASTRLISEYEWRINVAAEDECQQNGGEASGP